MGVLAPRVGYGFGYIDVLGPVGGNLVGKLVNAADCRAYIIAAQLLPAADGRQPCYRLPPVGNLDYLSLLDLAEQIV
jgi:hypothetical protein